MHITIPTNTLKAMLGFAAKKDERHCLNGLCLDFGPRYTALVGTTGKILGAYKLDDTQHETPSRVILPREAIETALKAAGKAPDITITDTHIGLVPYTPIDGHYANWQSVIPVGEGSGVAAQVDADLVVLFKRAAKLLGDSKWQDVNLWHNGPEGYLLVTLKDENFVGVLTTLRQKEAPKRPEWI